MDAVRAAFACALVALAGCAGAPQSAQVPMKPYSELIAASPASDWRRLDPENTVYMDLANGRVVIELAPAFAPRTVANLKILVRERYFDGLAVVRVQDNFVAQWGDPDEKRALGSALKAIAPEFTRAIGEDLGFMALPDPDTYAQAGFASGMPAARDAATGRAWLVHCYGMVGVGRGNEPDSGNGAELYTVIGHAPRPLDRNITVAGRIVRGIELLSALPRGTGPLGFYERPEQRMPIRQVRMAADVPAAERVALELLRTDSATFRQVIEARRFHKDDWYQEPAGRVDVCNIPLPSRLAE